jgi:thiol-disulfide isomerase/thioredoxin
VRHPVLLGLAIALFVSLVALFAARTIFQNVDPGATDTGVRIAEVWAARLPDLAGREQALRQWQGRVVVLNFWAPWCPPCREETPGFIRLHNQYANQGVQFVGVALDDPAKVAAYVDATGIPYPILVGGDAGIALGRAAGNHLGGLPYTLVLDRQGQAREMRVGGLDAARLEAWIQPLL